MKRIIMVFLALLLCTAMTAPAFAEGPGSITIRLSESSLEIGTGSKISLAVETDSTEKIKYTWESSDKKIASVDGKGNVSGVKEGEAVITCTAVLNKETVATAACKVKVFTSVKSVKAASPVKGNIIFVNKPVQIETTVKPDNAAYPKLVWSSSDESVATVDESGVVTAHLPGKVKITCETNQPNQAKAVTASIQLTVKQPVEEIRLSAAMLVLWLKDSVPDGTDSAEITMEALPENADNRKVKWETTDKNVAAVNNGKITANKAGACEITVTAADGGGTVSRCEVIVLSTSTFRINASALEDTGVVFTEDAGKATETAGRIVRTALDRLAETENTSRAAVLNYFARAAAANGKVFLTGSPDKDTVPLTVVMQDDQDNCALLSYDPVWGSFYFSTARNITGNDFKQIAVDGAAFGEMLPKPAAEGE